MNRYSSHIRTTLHLALPVMLSQLGHMMVNVADAMMVGRIGAVPLAAASLAMVIFNLLLMFGIGVSYGITPLVAAADGSGDQKQSAVLLRHAFLVNLATSFILVTCILLTGHYLRHLDQPADVVGQALPYLRIITFSLIPLMIFQTYRQFAEGLSRTKMAMVIVIGSNLINVILNYILIYGKLGFEPMGLNGAGYATLISRIILAAGMAAYIFWGKAFQAFRPGFWFREFNRRTFRRLIRIGLPAGFQYVFEVGAFGFAVIMIGWIGTIPLAAHQIAINMAAVTYMAATGLSAAATIRVGNQRGLKDYRTLREAAFTIYGMVIVFMGCCAVIFITCRFFLPALYIDNQEVIGVAGSLLVIAGFFQLSDGVQVVSLGALRGLEDVKIPTLLTFIAYWVIALPTGYLLAFPLGMGARGVWFGLLTGLTIVAVVMFIRFNHLTKKLLTA